MTIHLLRDLESLDRQLLSLSAIVEEMIASACEALTDRKPELSAQVIKTDDIVDQREVRLEEECLKVLALHQPVASDLRRVTAVLKINNDLERIGDLAVNIAQRAGWLTDYPAFRVPSRLREMAAEARSMVGDSLDAFVRLDADSAREICLRDDNVDLLNAEIINDLRNLMQTDPELLKPALYLFSGSRHIERIADHATNIAEDVIYLVHGEITRHQVSESFRS